MERVIRIDLAEVARLRITCRNCGSGIEISCAVDAWQKAMNAPRNCPACGERLVDEKNWDRTGFSDVLHALGKVVQDLRRMATEAKGATVQVEFVEEVLITAVPPTGTVPRPEPG